MAAESEAAGRKIGPTIFAKKEVAATATRH
jgi:hypothetical protein